MINNLNKINQVINKSEKRKLIYLSILKFFSGFMDMIGVASVAPFIAVISNQKILDTNETIIKIKSFLGLENSEVILFFAFISLALIILNQLVRVLDVWYENFVTHSIWLSFHTQLFNYYLAQPYSFHIQTNSNRLLEKLSIQANSAVAGLVTPFFQMLGNIFTFIFIVSLLFLADPVVALVLSVATGLFYIFIHSQFRKKISSYGEYGIEFSQAAFKLTDQAFRSIKDIKIKNNASYYLDLFRKRAKKYVKNSINFQLFVSFPRSALETFAYTSGFAIVIFFILIGTKQFNEFAVILGIYAISLQKLLPAVQGIFNQMSLVRYHKPSFDLVYEDLYRSLNIYKNSTHSSFEEKIFNLKQSISFNNINFKYPQSEHYALQIEDLKIKSGSFVGVTGKTGSGKSTFIDILIGLLKPSSGIIKIDGQNLDEQILNKWKSTIGYVPQFSFVADDTIINNIALGLKKEEIDIKKVKKACEISKISNFIENELAEKYNTQVGENGIRLSGGQRQRLSIARALYRNPSVIVLDEATNALDNLTEQSILGSLLDQKNITIILITHRLSTLKKCDEIIFLDRGKVQDIGQYDNLIIKNQTFKNLSNAENS